MSPLNLTSVAGLLHTLFSGNSSAFSDITDNNNELFASNHTAVLSYSKQMDHQERSGRGDGGRVSNGGGGGDDFEFVVKGVLLTAVSLFGLVGNAVSIAVLARAGMRGSFSTLLIGLSFFDILYLLIGIAIFGLPTLSVSYTQRVYVHILPVGFGLGHVGRVGSVFVTMSVTIERYFAIVHPLRHFSQKKYLLPGSTLVAVLFDIPKFFELETKVLDGTNVVSGTALRLNTYYVTYYIFWSKFILVEIVPYLVILILNSVIIKKIWKSEQFRHSFKSRLKLKNSHDMQKNSRQRREANSAQVLISISVLFIFCQSVKIIPDIYEVAFCRFGSKKRRLACSTTVFMESLIDVSHLLLAINSSANFILYMWRGEKFRATLSSALHIRRRRFDSGSGWGGSGRGGGGGSGGGNGGGGNLLLNPGRTECRMILLRSNRRHIRRSRLGTVKRSEIVVRDNGEEIGGAGEYGLPLSHVHDGMEAITCKQTYV